MVLHPLKGCRKPSFHAKNSAVVGVNFHEIIKFHSFHIYSMYKEFRSYIPYIPTVPHYMIFRKTIPGFSLGTPTTRPDVGAPRGQPV